MRRCLWCRKKATKLCDTLLVYRDNPEAKRGREIITCDAPLCDEHATTTPTTLRVGGGACETFDHCPFCKDELAAGRRPRLNAVDLNAFEQHRAAHVVASKRAAMHAVVPVVGSSDGAAEALPGTAEADRPHQGDDRGDAH